MTWGGGAPDLVGMAFNVCWGHWGIIIRLRVMAKAADINDFDKGQIAMAQRLGTEYLQNRTTT